MRLYRIYTHTPTQPQNHIHFTVLLRDLRCNKTLSCSSPKCFHHCRAMGEAMFLPSQQWRLRHPEHVERTTPSVALIRHKGEFWEERSDNHTPPILLHTTSTAHIFFEDARKYAAKAFVDAYSIIVPHYPANLGAVGSYELRVNFQLR